MSSTVMVCSQLAMPGFFDLLAGELIKYQVIEKRKKERCLFLVMFAPT